MANAYELKDPYPTLTAKELEMITGSYTGSSSTSVKPTWSGITTGAFRTPTHTMNRSWILQELVQDGYWVKATGSRVTKDGYASYSDWDYVVFDPDVKLHPKLISEGWTDGTSGREDGSFASLKMGEVNLILVKEEDQWKKWIIASNMIKALNSKTKEERIKVFDSVFGKDKNAEAVTF